MAIFPKRRAAVDPGPGVPVNSVMPKAKKVAKAPKRRAPSKALKPKMK